MHGGRARAVGGPRLVLWWEQIKAGARAEIGLVPLSRTYRLAPVAQWLHAACGDLKEIGRSRIVYLNQSMAVYSTCGNRSPHRVTYTSSETV
jgi:hypothetical protein